MIKKYRIGIMVYLFEVGSETYGKSCSAFGLTNMEQKQYIPVAGSIAVYEVGNVASLRVCPLDLYFPSLYFPSEDCVFPDEYELTAYERLALV